MHDYDRRGAAGTRMASDLQKLLDQMNKVRENTRPPPKPLTPAELHEAVQAVDHLEGVMKKHFGHDWRVIVMGNGTAIRK